MPLLVRRLERRGDLRADRERSRRRGSGAAREPLCEVLALDQLHHQEALPVGLVEAVDRARCSGG